MVFAVFHSMVTGSCGIHTKNKSPECHPAWLWDAGVPVDAVLPEELRSASPSVLSLCCSPLLYLCRINGASRGSFDVQANGAAQNFTPGSVTQPSLACSDLRCEVAVGKEKLQL